MGIAAGLIATALVGAGTSAYQGKRARDSAHDAGQRADRMTQQRDAELKNREQITQQGLMASEGKRRDRLRALASQPSATTRSGSPLGLPGGGNQYAGRSLLG